MAFLDGAPDLHQQPAQRLADLVVEFAGEVLPLGGRSPFASALGEPVIFEPSRHPHDVADTAGDELEDGDTFGGENLTPGLPLFPKDEDALGSRAGEEWQNDAHPGRR